LSPVQEVPVERIRGIGLELPSVGETLERFVAKIKQEVSAGPQIRIDDLPVCGRICGRVISRQFIEFAPLVSQFAVAAVAKVPAVHIGIAKPIARTSQEAENSLFPKLELRELKRIQVKSEQEISAIVPCLRDRCIGICAPVSVKFRKHRPAGNEIG
jgi:hypothetical protein